MSSSISEAFRYLPVVTLTGPRQSGKTTLCRELFPELPYANLEDAAVMDEVQADPKAFLGKYPQGVIIDEAQNYPELFSYLQVLVDEDRFHGRSDRHFIVTGSNNFSLIEKVTQSMAGRTAVMTLLPLSTQEIMSHVPLVSTSQLILNGGYPAVWTADDGARPLLLSNYYTTYIERDVRRLINVRNLRAFQTFIRLCAGRVGQEFNASSISNEIGVAVNTIRSWLSILNASYVVHLLQPYYANISKRLTKTPKLYFYDTGLACALAGIKTVEQLVHDPLRGGLFENLVVLEKMKLSFNAGERPALYFYRDSNGVEVDMVEHSGRKLFPTEIKSSATFNPDFCKNLAKFAERYSDKCEHPSVVYCGKEAFTFKGVAFTPFDELG